ncbi:Protein THEM6 [Frankliniella fusca]|uniref:Protein THEM6 n=1 Tax=Frankliniella fusca TaxID=407009 RepID=A0AAE1H052_9NEOP|nr:Protein THEM6 [Frankliniella fusca]
MLCFLCWLVPLLLLLYVVADVNYFLRIGFVILWGRLFHKKVKATEGSTIYGFCTTQDVDIFWRHMNNARYVRDLDFARFHFYDRSGIYEEIMKRKGHALQGATTVRYRRTIPIFTAYKITTKVIHWDDKAIYIEQQFITVGDGFVRAIILSKQNILDIDVLDMMKKLTGCEPGEAPEELTLWLQGVEVASAKLRKKD